ncbi:hypothetical protein Ddc_04921 [Ditylenchus destructor]|nr:hypothetical protein Ddc_04921 [Ditylenchus destructor]
MVRRPTLKHFLAECNRRRSRIPMIGEEKNFDTYMASQNFRLQQKYWGRVRSASLTDPEKGKKGPQGRRRPRSMDALLAGDDEADNNVLTRRQSRKRTKKPNANEAPKGTDKNEDKNAESQSDEDESDEESEMMWPHSLRRCRAFSQPNLSTLERFEKVTLKYF